jgi:hypothetical protein
VAQRHLVGRVGAALLFWQVADRVLAQPAAPAVGDVVDEYLARVGVGVVTANARPRGIGADQGGLRGVLRGVPVAGKQVRGVPESPVARPREFGEVFV